MHTTSRAGLNGLILLLLVAGLAIGWLGLRRGQQPTPSDSAPAAPVQTQSVNPANAEDSDPQPVSPEAALSASRAPAIVQAVARSAPAQPAEPHAEPTPYTRQLVSALTSLDVSHGPLTAEQLQEWKQNLQTLTAQGAVAVPAIQEFLAQNKEVVFGSMGSSDLLGQPSMRSALINSLSQISGPEATAALVQTLQTSTLPGEIAQLAQALDQRAPGQYRQETLSAINEVLNMASNGQLPAGWDVGALFKTLQSYGDSSTASALEQLQGPYKYYSTMALAGLPDGGGVPSLVRQAQDTSAGSRRDFAYQMLAQVATQYQDAGAALLEQAKANQISDSAWAKIAMGLAGDQYQIGEAPPGDAANPALTPGLKTFHIGMNNQNFYSLPLVGNAQIQQRLALLDQLLGAASSPAAQAALQSARTTLSGLVSN